MSKEIYDGDACMEAIESHGWGVPFCLGNAMKYLWRCERKESMRQDLEKARWYIDRALQALEATDGR
jgi:hypothetical protein